MATTANYNLWSPDDGDDWDLTIDLAAMQNSVDTALQAAINSVMLPVGIPFPWLMPTPPAGFFQFDGQAISRTTYPQLFALFGTTFGPGNGTTTFNVPVCNDGRTFVGLDATQTEFNTVGKIGGAKTHTLTTGEMPSHNHADSGGLNPAGFIGNGSGAPGTGASATGNSYVTKTLSASGGGGAHNNLQPYRTVLYIGRLG